MIGTAQIAAFWITYIRTMRIREDPNPEIHTSLAKTGRYLSKPSTTVVLCLVSLFGGRSH